MRLLALLLVTILPSCELSQALHSQHATYSYVGKVRTEPPLKLDSNDYEVKMNFSGGEWAKNSAICFHRASTKIVDGEVRLKVFTGFCRSRSPQIYSFRLKEFSRSEYDLVYVDPDGTHHPVGKIFR